MAILSLEEFGDSMGMPYDTVKKNAQRTNIIKGTDGKIDNENPVNKVFYDKQIAKQGTKFIKKEIKSSDGTKSKRIIEKPTGLTETQRQYSDLDLRTRIANAKSKEREAELKNINLERLAGNSLPVDIVERILVVNFQAIFKNFEASIENMVLITVDTLGGTRKDSHEITKKLRVELSTIIDKTKKDVEHELKSEIKMVVESRSQGIRK